MPKVSYLLKSHLILIKSRVNI